MDEPLFLGIILNVTRHVTKLDNLFVVKKQLIQFLSEQVEISTYLYDEDNFHVYERGVSGSLIANYRKKDIKQDIAFRKTFYLTENLDVDANKFIVILTDNYEDSEKYKYLQGMMTAKKEDCDFPILVFGIGNTFDLSLKEVCSRFYQVMPEELKDKLTEVICSELKHKVK